MPRLRADVTCSATEDGMVLLDGRAGRYWQLNATGALVVRAFLDGHDPEQIIDRLTQARPVTRERAAADVTTLLDQLTRAGLVTAR
ncbi:lasso peptide biosynthesis PqqD family chaperone [Solihabitans fulvus]|uniref:Lasso peptide biosynthesis PqqD family chaperone n=1 Tax=Solihabitans fulvus TaxID=1892852 RepID=A0A5B2XWD2_9PSEU|nr:lasso peptide biosynthesis PqqD family chaperone [Solihabitans fulvus]KAA2267149.1 lasso peptide biosynthesis PqqD family chaperone [Solihabitans fulvus]